MNSVSIRNSWSKHKVSVTLARSIVRVVLALEQQQRVVTIQFCNNSLMRQMNKQYLNHDYATDVLAFPMGEGDDYLGDCLVSVEMAMERAGEFKHTAAEELALYIVHGVLHLLGYDDKQAAKRRVMRQKEQQAMANIKLLLKERILIHDI